MDHPPLDIVPGPRPERKASPASVLAAPRMPVTRWNRKYLLAGAAALASVVGLGFYLGFGGASVTPKKNQDIQAAVDTDTPQQPAIADRYAAGYADPALQAVLPKPGVAELPAPGTPAGPAAPAATNAVVQPDPARQAALEQLREADAASPFFAGGPADSARDLTSPALAFVPPPDSAVRGQDVADVQIQNGQGEKRQFAAGARAEDYLGSPLREPLSPWEVKAGTVIPAALVTAINSDLPGEVIAQVTEPVYDHATGRTVLIPQGSRLIGQYDSQVAYGQARALVAWNRLVMPNGRSINIGSMTGADLAGASGLEDRTDDHFWQLAKGIVLSTVFSVGAASAEDAGARSSGGLVVGSTGSGVSSEAEEVGQRVTERDLARQPTITVRAGWPLRVIVNKDMVLAPYQ